MMRAFRVDEGKNVEDAKAIPVSVFMKRVRSVPFPRLSLPASCAPEVLAQAILQACASASESTLRAERQQYAARYSWDDTARRWEDAWLQM